MNLGRTVFSQLLDFLPNYSFQVCVDRYQGDRYVKEFSCWDQFLCLAFAQFTYRESLRDIEKRVCVRSAPKLYHMGFRGRISRKHRWRTPTRNATGASLPISGASAHHAGSPDVPATNRSRWSWTRRCTCWIPPPSICRFVAVSLGAVSPPQKRSGQDAHAAGSARQHSDQCLCDQRRGARCPDSRSTATRSRSLLSARLRLFGFRTALRCQTKLRLLHHTRQAQHPILAARLAPGVLCDAECAPTQTIQLTGPRTAQLYPDPLRRIHYFDSGRKILRADFSDQQFPSARPHSSPTCIAHAGTWSCSFVGSSSIFISDRSSALRRTRSRPKSGWPSPFTCSWPSSKDNSNWRSVSTKILQILSITLFEKTPLLQGFSQVADDFEDSAPRTQLNLFHL